MKLVVSREDVKAGMALPDVDDIDDAIDRALVATHAYFEGLLDTSFEPVEDKIEMFYLDPYKWPVIPNRYFRCRLKHAFVKSASVAVTYGEVLEDIDDTDLDLTTDYYIDDEKGIIHVSDEYSGGFVRVTYDAGFDSDNRAPDWLKEAVLAYVPQILTSGQPNRATARSPMLEPHAVILGSHMRGTAFHLRSMF